MCGRFSFAYEDFSAIIEHFRIGRMTESYESRWNIAPSQPIPAVLADGSGRRFGSLKWGLLPAAWNGGGPKPINTRVETIQRNPVFRNLLQRRRVILPTTALDVWLDRTVSDYDQLMQLLKPYPEDDMEWYEVSPMVGNVRNDVPECVLPLN